MPTSMATELFPGFSIVSRNLLPRTAQMFPSLYLRVFPIAIFVAASRGSLYYASVLSNGNSAIDLAGLP